MARGRSGLLAGIVAIAGGVWSRRRLVTQWREIPHPFGGVHPRFPSGHVARVRTDDGAEIAVETAGSGPPVVFVHGVLGRRSHWGYVAERVLADGRTVIGVDQRGHGGSTLGSDDYTAERLGRDLATVFAELELTKVTLVGHSMGGIASLGYAVEAPVDFADRVDRLVLVAVPSRTDTALAKVGLRIMAQDDGTPSFLDRFVTVMTGIVAFGSAPSLELVEQAIDISRMTEPETRRAAADGLARYNLLDRIAAIRAPTQLIYGSRDLTTPVRDGRLLTSEIRSARLEVIPGAGHMIIWERVDDLVDAITTG